MNGYPVRCIGLSAFEGCGDLNSIRIPYEVENIGTRWTCQGWAGSSYFVHSYEGEIPFYGCSNLTSVTILSPKFSEFICSNGVRCCFAPNTLERISLAAGEVKVINTNVFAGCVSLIDIIIPEGVERIGEKAFSGCAKVVNIKLPNTLNFIDKSVFRSCSNLTDVTVPISVTNIGYSAFEKCSNLTNMVLPFVGRSHNFPEALLVH